MRSGGIRDRWEAFARWWAQGDAMPPPTADGKKRRSPRKQRLRHALIACGVSAVLGFLTVLDPLDQFVWLAQSRMVSKAPSGEIVFVGLDPEIAATTSPQARRNLADLLDKMRAAGPELVVLDVVLEEPSDPSADRQLRQAIAAYGDDIVLVKQRVDDLDGRLVDKVTGEFIAGDARQAPNRRIVNYMEYTWYSNTALGGSSGLMLTVPTVLAGKKASKEDQFFIDYRYNTYDFAALRSVDISDRASLAMLTDKRVVVGVNRGLLSNSAQVPGRPYVPASFIMILAAETLMGGVPLALPMWAPIAILGLALAASSRARRAKLRTFFYTLVLATSGAAVYLAVYFNISALFGPVFFALAAYATLRIWWRAKNRGILFDDRTNLRTFRALEREFTPQEAQTASFIVVRVHNFEEAISVLPAHRHSEYVRLLADRLRAADGEREMFAGGDGYFAWTLSVMGRERLTDHLLGTRLVCYDPITVDEHTIDVRVTFGVNTSADDSASRKLASARAAASRSDEADRPVVFAEQTAGEEQLWNVSIQHKIDQAIEHGHIFPAFQPQFSTQTGQVTGVEALVRWRDPARGLVPTDWLIDQCEKAGRMERLTRLMLQESIEQVQTVPGGAALRLSVNISATMLQDEQLFNLVRHTLEVTGFDPAHLTLELTETWHIARPEVAASLMERIAALGVRWALDDFGVKTATYDALLQFPIHELKIDRSLTCRVLDSDRGRGVVQSICRMGAEMNLEVVAEGVELDAEFQALRGFGCPVVQGFALAPPLPLADLRQLLSTGGTPRKIAR